MGVDCLLKVETLPKDSKYSANERNTSEWIFMQYMHGMNCVGELPCIASEEHSYQSRQYHNSSTGSSTYALDRWNLVIHEI